MFTHCNVGVLEAIFFQELEEYAVVYFSEGAFEVRVGCVYVTFGEIVSSYIMMCVEMLSYIFLWERNPSAMSLKIPLYSFCLGSNTSEDGCP